ncbi:MAG: hypothetical protein QOD93_1599 [Acetobacteraceae bacterium]|nr:hypothetical protein [Acetobacteraceae bacterium]
MLAARHRSEQLPELVFQKLAERGSIQPQVVRNKNWMDRIWTQTRRQARRTPPHDRASCATPSSRWSRVSNGILERKGGLNLEQRHLRHVGEGGVDLEFPAITVATFDIAC